MGPWGPLRGRKVHRIDPYAAFWFLTTLWYRREVKAPPGAFGDRQGQIALGCR